MDEVKAFDNMVFGLDIGTRSVVGTVGYRKPSGEFFYHTFKAYAALLHLPETRIVSFSSILVKFT